MTTTPSHSLTIQAAHVARLNDSAERALFAQRELCRDALAACTAINADPAACRLATLAYEAARDVASRYRNEAHAATLALDVA
jgi:hypothetical protein